ALSLVCKGERPLLRNIHRVLKHEIPVQEIEGFEQSECPEEGHRMGQRQGGGQRRNNTRSPGRDGRRGNRKFGEKRTYRRSG
ncbi:MAG: ATP-dependent RNA helicase RhlE, partial [Thermodesulfobacteriota bacterium]